MREIMKKVAILSLSLMLVSTFAVSPALPQMMADLGELGLTPAQVEWLFSLPSFAILGTLLLNTWLTKVLPERPAIILGLLLLSFGGSLPVFVSTYGYLVLSRLLLGMGIGLINARAIAIISDYYQGRERQVMLGLRGSAEVVGSALLTLLVGVLLPYSWRLTFLVYGLGLLVLLFYLVFVPRQAPQIQQIQVQDGLSRAHYSKLLGLAGLAFLAIAVNSANTLRLPLIVETEGLGTSQATSFLLSAMMLMGLVAGLVFGPLMARFRYRLFALGLATMGLAQLVMWQADHFWLLALGAMGAGFAYSLVLNTVFTHLSETIPKSQLNQATSLVLMGCNLGGGGAALILQFLGIFQAAPRFPFLVYGLILLFIASLLWARQGLKNHLTRP